MPMGIDSFSFDLFGITRRVKSTGREAVSGRPRALAEDQDVKADQHTERARDQENFFWGMFSVL
ncbi:hypothetical protein C0075_22215 [Rhizobium sp. KAs_5_22]|uniref:hypothetical protein n=1 Tax=Ciceribacter selenitireducens TaxID=448181 RepID=UPI00048AB1BF|nr:hypothetical protein [Ciceribacter selenitireducens]PPJ48201.1 hypothetical protein C0075_22215 [Rhizobium sp. KAs_5_22]